MRSIKEMNDKWENHLMVLAAFRYCLGRQTYIVSECIDWLISIWDEVRRIPKNLIIGEIMDALEGDCAGDPCDGKSWRAFLVWAEEKATSEEVAQKKENHEKLSPILRNEEV